MNSQIETSIIIPTYNEIRHINEMLMSLIENIYPKEKLEILIYDGESTDGTRVVLQEYANKYPFIKVYSNPRRLQVYALNLALKEIQGDYIIRCDAHARYPNNYIETLVEFLKQSNDTVGNIGGQAIGTPGAATQKAEAIAIALSHPFGVGLSHRSVNIIEPKEVDTVLFGAWKKSIFDTVGLFDENFVRGQDYEHNQRLICAGYKVLLLPELKFEYFTRETFLKLAKMVYQYAYAKTQIIKKYKQPPSLRVMVPMGFVSGIPVTYYFPIFLFVYVLYAALVVLVSFKEAKTFKMGFYLSVAFPIMHLAHGIGFIRGLVEQFILKRSNIEWNSTR